MDLPGITLVAALAVLAPPPSRGAPAPAPAPSVSSEATEASIPIHNRCKKQGAKSKFHITLPPQAELDDLVRWMSSVSCQRFIWDDGIRTGKVKILAPQPVTIAEASSLFHSALAAMGATVVSVGGAYRIVETQKIGGKTVAVYGPGAKPPADERFVTQLVRPPAGRLDEIVTVLGKLKGDSGTVEVAVGTVILTDTGANVRRMLDIVGKLDIGEASAERIYFHPIAHADPEAIAEVIRGIFGEPAGGTQSQVLIDTRTRTLIVVSTAEDHPVIDRAIAKLDVPSGGGLPMAHVVRLQHADPDEVVAVLGRIPSIQGGASTDKNAAPGPQVQGKVELSADPSTHKLIVFASAADFARLRPVIEELDEKKKQVYIEVHILELSVDHRIGASASGHFGRTVPTPGGDSLGFVGSAPNPDFNSLSPSGGSIPLDGLVAGLLGPAIDASGFGLGQDLPAFGVVIQALETHKDVNIVSQPHVYTADNKEALIKAGTRVPTPGQIAATDTTAFGPNNVTVNREDVSLEVKITPHLADDGEMTLDVEMIDRGIQGEPDPRLGVTTQERQIKLEQVLAYDDQPVVLGGLVRETEDRGVSQVPGLGSIPILGWLFKQKTRNKQKVNLLMILVPHVIDSPDDLRRIHERRRTERIEFLERYTSFHRNDLDANVNYKHKAGLLSAVNREAWLMRNEAVMVSAAERDLQNPVVSGDIGMRPKPSKPASKSESRKSNARPATPKRPRAR